MGPRALEGLGTISPSGLSLADTGWVLWPPAGKLAYAPTKGRPSGSGGALMSVRNHRQEDEGR